MKKGANMAGPIPMTDRNASMVGRVPSGPLSYNPPSHPTIHHIPLILKEASKEVKKMADKTKSRHRRAHRLENTSWSFINTLPKEEYKTNESISRMAKKPLHGADWTTL
ncbi:unnamed protein product [Microthlaspi erraticum]|uniref:Uncharacterized protein n=1 Tax=Microthlaspi erraticum TaxID=1685480 RepID=A0A6D2HTZ2_9BRAS|nr:unnamed protein product [Microthlaspi erraticum]